VKMNTHPTWTKQHLYFSVPIFDSYLNPQRLYLRIYNKNLEKNIQCLDYPVGKKKMEEEGVSMETTNNDKFPSQSFLQKTLLLSIYKLYIKNKVGTTWKVSNWATSYFSFSYLIQRRNYWKESD